jgi:thiosulfate/3-mercaptopyruvate sulfurtransferase
LEPYEKVLIDDEYLEEDPHAEISCDACHGGNPDAEKMEVAHEGIVSDPSFPDATKMCGDCHEEITSTNSNNLHITLKGFDTAIGMRTGSGDKIPPAVKKGMENHCYTCHSSCGQCHVSRPKSVDGGFVQGHRFMKTPPMDTNCTACHGSRIEREFMGKNKDCPSDVHYFKARMVCVACHTGDEMHGSDSSPASWREVENGPRCVNCHEDAVGPDAALDTHQIHDKKLSCQVCHSVAYKNCSQCHVGKDAKGLPFYKTQGSELNFKIGLNPNPSERHPYKYVTVRHVPVSRGTFDYYAKDAMKNFNVLPTWKLAIPHNIQRNTPQTESCNGCHGNKDLFLRTDDVAPDEREANSKVIVPDEAIPPHQ